MIVDSSALLAILLKEPEALPYTQAIIRAAFRKMSAGNFLESSMRLESIYGDEAVRRLDDIMATLRIEVADFTAQQAKIARRAFRKYGKGRHPAQLNFGDCIAYALAKDTGEPLLFKGDDFLKTDVTPVRIGKDEEKTGL